MASGALGFIGCRRILGVYRRCQGENTRQDGCESNKDIHIFHFKLLG
jgi:hypothetical protein